MTTKPTILYVDDDEANLSSFKHIFSDVYDILLANSATEALQLMRHTPVRLVLTDQRMPAMTGVELLQRIATEFPQVIRMLITGFSDIDVVIDAVNQGHIYYYFSKPWDDDLMKQVIDNSLASNLLAEENRRLIKEIRLLNDVLVNNMKRQIDELESARTQLFATLEQLNNR